MYTIDKLSEEIDFILSIIKKYFDIDSAIFNTNYELVSSTKNYLKNKGHTVHPNFLIDALKKENIIVNNPGTMPSCAGCRFKDNCPSTIELLNRLKYNDEIFGVISFTSFTKEGHDKIVANIKKYMSLVDNFSKIIANSIFYILKYDSSISEKLLISKTLDFIEDGIIITDTKGNIDHINNSALEMFSYCNMQVKSIRQLFDKNILPVILSNKPISNVTSTTNNSKIKISSTPIIEDNTNTGIIIKLSNNIDCDKNTKNVCSDESLPYSLDSIKGSSNLLNKIKDKIVKVKDSTSTVLITGETGTGKGLLAKAIHYESNRWDKPFITVNCTSIPENLFESELFGYEGGAFTGAKKEGKPGKFELANEGTLFLDEIGEMPLNLQAKLLRVLQDSTFERVGGVNQINVNVRIIAATNKDILKLIEEKKFRADLYYRINVIPIKIPSLKERKNDIIDIALNFLETYNNKLYKNIIGFNEDVADLFNNYDWPGNIRQLENIIEYSVNMTCSDIIKIDDLPDEFLHLAKSANNTSVNKVKENEHALIISTIDKYGWDVQGKTLAAKELGIGIRTLYRKLSEYQE